MSDTIYIVKVPRGARGDSYFFATREDAEDFLQIETDAYLNRCRKRLTAAYENLVMRCTENNIAAQALIDAGVENPLIALQTAPSRDNYIIPRLRREEEFFSAQTRITEAHRYVQ